MQISMRCIREGSPGAKWKLSFERTWPHYRKWYLKDGPSARPGYITCRDAIDRHMPELSPLYRDLCEIAGGGDLVSRYLSMYRPPAFMGGCTQVAWTRDDLALVRNYDYDLRWFEGVVVHTNWLRTVIGISDCNWGLLDGMNADGLAASLTFGGRRIAGDGFGIPLVLRYILETCATVQAAIKVLRRIPVHMTYNIMLMDRGGDYATVFLGPDRRAGVVRSDVCSNHQENIDWPEYAQATATAERETLARALLRDRKSTCSRVIKTFLRPPLYSERYDKSFGTLYTAAWFPARGEVRVSWPARSLKQSFARFTEKRIVIDLTKKPEQI